MSIFADDFLDMMTQEITVKPFQGRSDEGVPVYGTASTYKCRINYQTKNIIGGNGQLVAVRGQAWLATVDAISMNDLVTFPDGTVPVLLEVNQESDENSAAYTSFFFQ